MFAHLRTSESKDTTPATQCVAVAASLNGSCFAALLTRSHPHPCNNEFMKRREIKQYEFVRKIGAGGSGVVYLANDTLLQRPVVLKLLKRGNLTTEQMRATQLRKPPSPPPSTNPTSA